MVERTPREVRLYADARGRCPFELWLSRLRDARARAIIRERIARLMLGNPGDGKPVGEGVSEMRVDFGPGYRIYYAETANRIVVLLSAGDKHSQSKDIENAKIRWAAYKRLTSHA